MANRKGKGKYRDSRRKKIVELATVQAMGKNKYGSLTQAGLQEQINGYARNGEKIEVIEEDINLIVYFERSDRYYNVDAKGDVTTLEVIRDNTPGDITRDKDENELDGIERPFEIWSIEDLVAFSNITGGSGYKLVDGQAVEITEADNLSGKKVALKINLDFQSNLSYLNSKRTDFGDINGNAEDGNELKTEMTTGTGFEPIKRFNGSFDGEGHEIRNIFIDTDQNAALFVGGSISKIENLGITGKITSTGGQVAGMFAMQSSYPGGSVSLIENCWNKAEIIGGSETFFAAGISARGAGRILNCYNFGNITNNIHNNAMAGGICSSLSLGEETIENCYNTGTIIGNYSAGGIASGYSNYKTTVRKCYNTGDITGRYVGGILGGNGKTIENCFNTGKINAPGNSYAGGICGTDVDEIYNCYNTGDVSGNYVGGICTNLKIKMINCYNTGEFTGNRVRRFSLYSKVRCDNRKLL